LKFNPSAPTEPTRWTVLELSTGASSNEIVRIASAALARARHEVPVDDFGDADRGVAKLLGEDLQRDFHGDEERGARMAQLVDRPVAETRRSLGQCDRKLRSLVVSRYCRARTDGLALRARRPRAVGISTTMGS